MLVINNRVPPLSVRMWRIDTGIFLLDKMNLVIILYIGVG